VAELLLQRGARVDARDADGDTPLHDAARWACIETMRRLLDRGAEVDARNDDELTPLMVLLVWHERNRVFAVKGVELLAGRGADVNAVDEDGRTPLSYAVEHACSDPDVIPALLDAGARAKQDSGPWLLDELLAAARRKGRPPSVVAIEALLDAGAGASLTTVSRLSKAATAFGEAVYHRWDLERLFNNAIPGLVTAAQRTLDEDEGARVAARLAAAVAADRRDVASGLRALITGAAAERRRLEAARVAAAQERRAAAAALEAVAQERRAAAAERVAAEERRAAAAAERKAAAQERRAAAAERAELLRLRAEVAALAGGGGAAIAAEGGGGGGGGGGGEAGPLAKRARGG
jgi:hypothetical protein